MIPEVERAVLKEGGAGTILENNQHRTANRSPTVCIRSYREEDREAIRRICCETGFLGAPIDSFFSDRQLYADLLTGPYLDYEPEWALVAEVEQRVVGYLLGSTHTHFDAWLMRSGFFTAAKMAIKLFAGCYAAHPPSERFVRWLWFRGYWQQPRHPSPAAHLHLNLEPGYRGRSIGRRLWELYERRLGASKIRRCYGAFYSYPARRPELVYSRYGFSVYDRRRTTLFQHELDGPVEIVCVHKQIASLRT